MHTAQIIDFFYTCHFIHFLPLYLILTFKNVSIICFLPVFRRSLQRNISAVNTAAHMSSAAYEFLFIFCCFNAVLCFAPRYPLASMASDNSSALLKAARNIGRSIGISASALSWSFLLSKRAHGQSAPFVSCRFLQELSV